MKTRLNQLILLFNNELSLFLYISFGVFLYVLSFQPFQHDDFDFYYRLFFKAGFGIILFLIMFLVRVLYPCVIETNSKNENKIPKFHYLRGSVIWVLSVISFLCYLKYVGHISISADVTFKVFIICTVPPVVLIVSDRFRKMRVENKLLVLEKEDKSNNEDYKNLSIDFVSGVNGRKLSFILEKILFIKSANNYVEIHYLEEDQIKKKLLRNTITNIELQIKSFPDFIRCHRTCIVNKLYIEIVNGNCNNRSLNIKGYHKPIPVSRLYHLKVKEVL